MGLGRTISLCLALVGALPLNAQILSGIMQSQGAAGSQVATPTFSPVGGTYLGTQTVTISTVTSLAVLCYTTDGSTPTESGNLCSGGTTQTYSTPISVTPTQTVKALGTLATYIDSSVGTAVYTLGISFNFTTGTLPTGTTFTRSSSGTYINGSGTLATATTDTARFQYVSGTPYLLYEPAATNLALQSNSFSTTPWVYGGATANSPVASPDGTTDGWSFSITGYGQVYQNIAVTAIPYTMSLWAYNISGCSSMYLKANTSFLFGTFTVTGSWVRYAKTATPTAGSGQTQIGLNESSGTCGFYGFQLETGSVATSYFPTTTGSGTRSADQLTFTIPSGTGHLTVTFSDNTTQSISVSPGSYTLTNILNEYLIKTIVGTT